MAIVCTNGKKNNKEEEEEKWTGEWN